MNQPLLLLSISAVCLTQFTVADPPAGELVSDPSHSTIINGTDWVDVEGRPIMAHEGDLARFDGVFCRYGSSSAKASR